MSPNKPFTCCNKIDNFYVRPQVGYGVLPDGRVYFSGVRRQKGNNYFIYFVFFY